MFCGYNNDGCFCCKLKMRTDADWFAVHAGSMCSGPHSLCPDHGSLRPAQSGAAQFSAVHLPRILPEHGMSSLVATQPHDVGTVRHERELRENAVEEDRRRHLVLQLMPAFTTATKSPSDEPLLSQAGGPHALVRLHTNET
jgi:hypothetical protein